MFRVFASVLLVFVAVVAEDEKVVTVTGGMFDSFLTENEVTMVEFYAPWCGHCKKLLPEFEGAAGDLEGDGIKLGKVDCTDEDNTELCKVFEVRGYPTIKFFNKGQATAYEGGRERADIVRYIQSRTGPAVVILEDVEAAKTFASEGDIVVLPLLMK
eukprot:TRINITY_DN2426_c0_g1_i1.p2 TRINITY_DN2426_c0_g1~~TRINITY_DN2426_c0_g1_i1.p2  ORF type:complete len:157 (-),score=46.58 TRINITY_DN2426_c0_g1_i1:1112-1582(-)